MIQLKKKSETIFVTMLTKRQAYIQNLIQSHDGISVPEIIVLLENSEFEKISRITLIRDLNTLIESSLIKRSEKARATRYFSIYSNPLLRIFDVGEYFKTENRNSGYQMFNFDIFDKLPGLFSESEIVELENINRKIQININRFSETAIQKEIERITVEFSWKSSQLEGNTYSLLDTERLIKDRISAKGHSVAESIMILNHKEAMDFIFQNCREFRKLNITKIEEIHKIITKNLGVNFGLRKSPVGIIGTDYKPLDNQFQIKEALESLCERINKLTFPIEKALALIAMVSYIQPFEDGNKRTSRILGNAVLMAHNFCPLSYRSVDEVEYKKAMILFYEQNSIAYFKEIFITQFKNAVEKYF